MSDRTACVIFAFTALIGGVIAPGVDDGRQQRAVGHGSCRSHASQSVQDGRGTSRPTLHLTDATERVAPMASETSLRLGRGFGARLIPRGQNLLAPAS